MIVVIAVDIKEGMRQCATGKGILVLRVLADELGYVAKFRRFDL